MAKLLRRKHPQQDMFICDILDATPKDDIGSMEHPMFTLSKKPDHGIRHYEHKGEYIEITPSVLGMATIFDKDILIFAMSQLMAKINNGEEPSQIIQFSAYDLLVTTNKATSGAQYERLKAAFKRLEGTRIETCIKAGGKEITQGFGLIDYWKIIRETPKGRMEGIELKLSDWLYQAILAKEVLSISPDYFRLGKPIERRIYEICRKHCGKQAKWIIGLHTLQNKTGSKSTAGNFKADIKKLLENNDFPDYKITLEQNNIVVRPHKKTEAKQLTNTPILKPQTYTNAAKILQGSGLDKYSVEQDWLKWIEGKEPPANYDGAFIGFCKMQMANL